MGMCYDTETILYIGIYGMFINTTHGYDCIYYIWLYFILTIYSYSIMVNSNYSNNILHTSAYSYHKNIEEDKSLSVRSCMHSQNIHIMHACICVYPMQ